MEIFVFELKGELSTLHHLVSFCFLFFVFLLKHILANKSNDEFEINKKNLEAQWYAPPTNLGELSDRYWYEINNQTYRFDSTERELKVLRTFRKIDLITYFEVSIEIGTFISLEVILIFVKCHNLSSEFIVSLTLGDVCTLICSTTEVGCTFIP